MIQNLRFGVRSWRSVAESLKLYLILTGASLICGGLFLRVGYWSALQLTVWFLGLSFYGLIAWRNPPVGLGILVFIPLFSESQTRPQGFLSELEYGMHSSFNTTIGGPPITPIEVVLVVLMGVTAVKWFKESQDAKTDPTIVRRPLFGDFRILLVIFGIFVMWGFVWGVGIRRGDTIKGLWEIRAFAYMFAVYVMGGILLRDTKGWMIFFQITISAIGLVGVKVVYRFFVYIRDYKLINDHSFDHENALFYNSFLLLGVAAALLKIKSPETLKRITDQGWGRRWWIWYGSLLPFVLFAMLLQQRRGGFATLGFGMIAFFVLAIPQKPAKFIPIMVFGAIFVLGYYLAFANSVGTPIGQPARAIKSMIAPSARDKSSNEYREIEYFNLVETINTSPILGIGFGQEFLFVKPMPSLSFWPFWHYTPHNEILWVWLKVGLGGFIFFWLLFAQACLKGAWLVWKTRGHVMQPAIFVAMAAIFMQLVYAWLDQGYSRPRNLFWLGMMLSLLGFWKITKEKTNGTDIKRAEPQQEQ